MDNQFQKALGQAQSSYIQGAVAGNMPREIGIIDRVQGINGGLSELYARLSSMIERVEGSGPATAKANPLPPPGLSNVLSDAEANLRGCMELLGQLNAKL